MACLFQKIVSFDKESYFCIETINIKLSFHSMNFVEELKWRGMVHTMMPGTEEPKDFDAFWEKQKKHCFYFIKSGTILRKKAGKIG